MKGGSKSVQLLLHGIDAVMALALIVLKQRALCYILSIGMLVNIGNMGPQSFNDGGGKGSKAREKGDSRNQRVWRILAFTSSVRPVRLVLILGLYTRAEKSSGTRKEAFFEELTSKIEPVFRLHVSLAECK